MANKNNSWSKPQNPHKNPNALRYSLLHNTHFSEEIEKSLFRTLNASNSKSAYEFVDTLETTLDWKNGNGILESMTNPSNPAPYALNFDTIKNESFSLAELGKAREESLLALPPLTTANGTVHLESVIVEILKKDIGRILGNQKAEFEQHIWPNPTLVGLLRDIDFFLENMLQPSSNKTGKKKSNPKQDIQNYKLPFAKIKSELEAQGVDFAQINAGTAYGNWPDEQKNLFDAMTSKMLIVRMQDRITKMTDLMRDVDDVFSQVLPPFSTFFKKYPFNFALLKAQYPAQADQIEQLYASITPETTEEEKNQIIEQASKLEIELYLQDLQTKAPQLVPIFKKLIDENFDLSKLWESELTSLFSDLAKARLQEMKAQKVIDVFDQYNPANFEAFFLELFDFSKGDLNLWNAKLKIEKKADAQSFGGISSLSDIAQMTEIPLTFTLSDFKKSGLSAENLQMLEKLFGQDLLADDAKVELKGRDIWKLMYLYVMMTKGSLIQRYDPTKVKNRFQNLDNGKTELNRLKTDLNDEKKDQDEEKESKPESSKTPEELKSDFYEARDGIKGEKSDAPDHGFAPGALMYLQLKDGEMESQLPPFSTATNERLKVEITAVDHDADTFKVKMHGTELKLAQGQEGQEMEYAFEDFNNIFVKNDKIDKAIKILPWKDQPGQLLQALAAADIGADQFSDLQFKGEKLMFNQTDLEGKTSEQEATHFGITDEVMDNNSSALKKNSILYKITPKGNGKLIVSGEIPDMEGERKKYEKEMSYPDFLLFVANKKLAPKTEKSAQEEQAAMQDIRSHQTRKRNRVSPAAMFASIKNVWKNLNGKIDEYYKDQESACLDRLIADFGIYHKIGKMMPGLKSVASATRKLHDEHLSKKESAAWKAIDEWVKTFGSMQDFAALFADGIDHPSGRTIDHAIGKWNTLKKILLSGKSVYDDSTLRPIMAAAMIANIKQGKGLYRGISEQDNQGLWVRCLLGEEHHKRFLAMKAEVLAKLKAEAIDSDQLQDRLKKGEIDYILNNIRNANAGVDFGSIDDNNAQVLKQLYSEQFAKELESAANDTFWKSAIEGAYNKIPHNNFNLACQDFKRLIGSGRIESALGNLLKMGDLAKTKRQQDELKMAMTYVNLSGIMNRYGDKKVRKRFDAMARTIMLPTAFGAKKWKNQDFAWDLLDNVKTTSGPRFSEAMAESWKKGENGKTKDFSGISRSDFSMTSQKVDYKNLLEKLRARWGHNSEDIDKYFNSLKYKNPPEDKAEAEAQKQLWAVDGDNVDPNWRANPWITGIYPIFASPAVIEDNKRYDRDGFQGKDEDERNSKIEFWKNQLKALKSAEKNKIPPERMLQTFLTWFKSDNFATANYPERISRIRTAQAVKKFGNDKEVKIKYKYTEEGVEQTGIANAGKYGKEDYKNIVDYLFRGYVLRSRNHNPPKEFNDVLLFFKNYFTEHLDKLDDKVLASAFGSENVSLPESKRKILIPWQDYNRQMSKNQLDNFGKKGQKTTEEKWKNLGYRNTSLCVNHEMAQLSQVLNRNGIPIAELTGVSVDEVQTMVDDMYDEVV